MENYLIIIEKAQDNYSAYSPDVDGCAATGKTADEARKNYLEALAFHIDGLKEDGLKIPKPVSKVAYLSEDCSGIINFRTKKSIHHKLLQMAKDENHSQDIGTIEPYHLPRFPSFCYYVE